MNNIFQYEDPDPVTLNKEFISFVKTLMVKVVLPGYAMPANAEWEQRIVHVREGGFGLLFSTVFEKSSLCDSDKVFLLKRCRKFLIACIKGVLK
ncbi:hypothetical protein HPB48_016706 [Haemaphysalis longicornis]|uniref:Uncharacterized protein n=1 Tax=Haemaphysalis longicornis TaxID=44386 RepID=A0A9J6GAE5_HAELO|nr:hypothetical protein HPB48_016706 [Haemaphysalis longicornis]